MSGDFHFNVNFDSRKISDFYMRVDGGGKYAEIKNGTATIEMNIGHWFEISNADWSLNGNEPTHKWAEGEFYGYKSPSEVGGSWGMYKDCNNGAAGIFYGKRSGK